MVKHIYVSLNEMAKSEIINDACDALKIPDRFWHKMYHYMGCRGL